MRTNRSPEVAKPSSSSKRTSGARHAYLARSGVVVISSATVQRGTLEHWTSRTDENAIGLREAFELTSPPWDEAESIDIDGPTFSPPWDDEPSILSPAVDSPPWDEDDNNEPATI